MTKIIEFDHVSKNFGDKRVLNNLNFSINEGEFFVLVGPSGSGKTTAIKMINALYEPTEGNIYFKGKRIKDHDLQQLRWNMGYVLQNIALFPTMTVAENISLIPELKGTPKEDRRKRVDELLEKVGLPADSYRDRMPHELSGGQQQRIGILRAIAAEPDLILMDEAFSSLDPISRTALQDEILDIHRSNQTTIVFVTHDMDEALKLGSRIGIMNEGELVELTTSDKLQSTANSRFVDDFFGRAINENKTLLTLEQIIKRGYHSAEEERGIKVPGTMTLIEAFGLFEDNESLTVEMEDGENLVLDRANIFSYLSE